MTASNIKYDFLVVLKKAMKYDEQRMYKEALNNYKISLELMLNSIKDCSDAATKKTNLEKVKDIIKRAEEIERILKKDTDTDTETTPTEEQVQSKGTAYDYKSEVIEIEEGAKGYDYEYLFGKYLDKHVTEVTILDAHIRTDWQIMNLVRLSELLVQKTKIKVIHVTTGQDQILRNQRIQKKNLDQLRKSLKLLKVELLIEMESTATKPRSQIKLNNGWRVKMARGLDLFKASEGLFSVGACDMKFRKCHRNTVHIFHHLPIICPSTTHNHQSIY